MADALVNAPGMRYHSTYVISFEAESDDEARSIAVRHHEQLRDELCVEGADHPVHIVLKTLEVDGRQLLDRPRDKTIWGERDTWDR